MNKKNDKKLCWNCDGSVSLQIDHCPYCGVDLTRENAIQETPSFSRKQDPVSEQGPYLGHPFQRAYQEESIPPPPYANFENSAEEWVPKVQEEAPPQEQEEAAPETSNKNDMIAFLLLLPGIVFFLFGLVLLFFSDDGVLTLEWNQSFAYFYFLGALPLLILGWRALR